MSGGSSCSQTPSRAIPTRRVALGDGVQLPPGDYSTTPGGTLFSTTPGGKARGRGSQATSSGAGGHAGLRDRSHARATGVAALPGFRSWIERTRGFGKAQEGHRRLGCPPPGCSGAWSGDGAAPCPL